MKIRYKNCFDKRRRDLLKTITSAGISKSLLNATGLAGGMMISRLADAQDSGPDKVLNIYMAGGGLTWVPDGNLNVTRKSQAYETEGIKNEVNFLSNSTLTNVGHYQMGSRFNCGKNTSFDALMGNTISADRAIDLLNLGVEQTEPTPTRNNGNGIATINDPRTAFSRLNSALGSVTPPDPGNGGTGDSPRALYLDLHKDAINALTNRLGQEERIKLESHLNSIEEVEQSLSSAGGIASCSSLMMPPAEGANAFDVTARQQIEIAVLALACNLTASVSICFGNDVSAFYVPGYDNTLHNSHHCCGVNGEPYDITAGYVNSLVARSIRRLKDVGILDSTIVTMVSDMGDGDIHAGDNCPSLVAGGGSALQRGRVTNAGNQTQLPMYEAVARILNADQHPNYSQITNNPMSGLAS